MWRVLVLGCAALLFGAVLASAEQSRPGSTLLGRALGLASTDDRLAKIADAQILRGTRPSAVDLAATRRAAVAEPLSPLPFYILAANDNARDAGRAIAGALQRDPRFRPAYRWQAATFARGGDIAGATHALIRLAVLSPTDQTLWPAIAKLTADPVARRVIKAEIARGVAWRDGYLAVLSASPVDRGIVFDMLQSSGKQAAVTAKAPQPGQPDDRRAFIAAMVARKDYERAYLAWVQWLPEASQAGVGHVFDGGFKGLAALPPFTWDFANGVGGATAIDPATGLSLDYSGTDGAVLATQTLLLAPGRYRLMTAARFDAVAADGGVAPLEWTLACVGEGQVLATLAVPLEGALRRADGAPFAVASGCDAQVLTLRVNPADITKRLSGHIRAVAVEAVP